ncbi:MAG: tetratricopeptide repeat protein [Rikenellaceae bacterium]
MKLRYFVCLSMLFAIPIVALAQREQQKIYIESSKDAQQRYDRGCELYEKDMFAAAVMELEASVNYLKEPYSIERAKFYIAHSKAMLQKKYTNTILEEYLNNTGDNSYKNKALVLLIDNNLLLEKIDTTKILLTHVDPSCLDPQTLSSYKYAKAYIALSDNEIEGARELFTQVSKSKSKHQTDAIYYLGYIAYLKGDYTYALEAFNKAIAQGGTFSKTDAYIAQIKFAQGDYTYIIQNQDKLLQYNEDKKFLAEINRMIALSYYNSKDYVSTIDFMDAFNSLGGAKGRSEYYVLGYSYYMMNNYGKAIEQFVNILDDKDKTAQSAYYLLGDAYIKTGNKANAMKAFSMAADMDFDGEIAEDALYNNAKLTYEIDQSTVYTNKIDVLNRYYKKYPNSKHSDEISGYLLNLYINSGDNASALSLAEKVKNPSSEVKKALQRTYFDQGIILFQNKEYDAAIKIFEKSRSYEATPKYTALSQFWIAECRYAKGEYNNDVVWLYKKYQAASSPNILEWQMANYSIAYSYFNSKEYGYAITWFNKFIDNYKGDNESLKRDAYIRIADSWFARRDYKRADDYYAKAAKIADGDYLDYQRAITYGMVGNNNAKIKDLKEIVAKAKSQYYQEAIMELTSTYLKLGQFADAKKVAQYMINNCENSVYYPNALINLAVAESNMDNGQEAIAAYQRVVREYPASQEAKGALIALKSIYVSQGNVNSYFAFVNSIGRSSELGSDDKEQLSFEAIQHLYTTKAFDRAIDEGYRHLTTYPNGLHTVDVTYYIADAYSRLGKDNSSLKYLEKLMKMPQNQYSVAAYSQATDMAMKEGDYKKAYTSICGVMRYSTEPTERREALERSMDIALLTKDGDIIKETYRNILAAKNISAEPLSKAWYAYGKELYGNKEYRKAIDQFKKVNLSHQNEIEMESLYLTAECYYNLGEYVNAEKSVMALSKGDTPHQYWVAKGFVLLGDTYVKRGDKFQAKATYKSIVDGYGDDNDGIKAMAKKKLNELLK